ncbi:hypothetical protein CLOP_g21961 [Closterium sp. NIES-67]|nr:hypothetical protein CLOP_g21961 [Closterium sp. NIES-67]
MKHRNAFRKLGRASSHRWGLLRTMVSQLIQHERIETTVAKAKELRSVADRMVTLAKEGTLQSRREAAAVVRGKDVLQKLFYDLSERYKDRAGGYTRVLPTRTRVGDAAPMAYIEYIDRPDELRRSRPPSVPPPPSEPQAPWLLSSLRRHWAPPAAVPSAADAYGSAAASAGDAEIPKNRR